MPGIAEQIRELVRSAANHGRRIRRLETLPDPVSITRPQGGHIIQDEGNDLPDQARLDFIGVGVTAEDDLESGKTTVTIPGAVQEIINTTIGASLDKIILIFRQGSGWSGFNVYEPTSDGFDSALASANPGAVIYVPPVIISGDHIVPADVEIWGVGRDKTIFSGEIILSSDSVLNNLSIIRSVNLGDGTITKGVIGTSSGTSFIFDCIISVTNIGSSQVRSVDQPAGGVTDIWESDISAIVAGTTTAVGRYNQACYAIYVTDDGEVVHRFCNIRAAQDSTDQRNPFYDDIGSVFTIGSTVGTGSFDVDAEVGSSVGGMTVGNWYSLENTGGPWDNGDISDMLQYGWCISFDDGTTWDVIESLLSGDIRHIYIPPACEHTETEATNYARTYFKAAATSIKIRVADGAGLFGDNVGSMGYTLKNATIELDATQAYASDIIDPLGATVPVPHLGDRSAYDVDDYDTKHASDIYNAIFLRHLPTSGNDGNVIYDDDGEWKSGTPEDAGLSGGADPGDAYWEPAVDADGGDILFTADGDVAMVWVS